jgi:hypothetical protein
MGRMAMHRDVESVIDIREILLIALAVVQSLGLHMMIARCLVWRGVLRLQVTVLIE